jgi:SAM-dependent methyltransferase
MDLKEAEILSTGIEKHWYYSSKSKALSQITEGIIPKKILDVGAGSGFFSRYLLTSSGATEAWCVDIGYEVDSDQTEQGKPVHYRRSIDDNDADLLLFMDVLEHVDDDIGLLQEYVDKAPSGSRFVVTVPAFSFLWSGHDVFLEHRRRYTLAQLEQVIQTAGLRVRCGAYYFGMVFPIAVLLRLAQRIRGAAANPQSQLKMHGALVNTALSILCKCELQFMKINRLAGLTVFCLAEKP